MKTELMTLPVRIGKGTFSYHYYVETIMENCPITIPTVHTFKYSSSYGLPLHNYLLLLLITPHPTDPSTTTFVRDVQIVLPSL